MCQEFLVIKNRNRDNFLMLKTSMLIISLWKIQFRQLRSSFFWTIRTVFTSCKLKPSFHMKAGLLYNLPLKENYNLIPLCATLAFKMSLYAQEIGK